MTLQGELIASIDTHSIRTVKVLNQSVEYRRVSPISFLLFGMGAYTFKERVREKKFFLIITWQDGESTHKTTFEYDNSNMPERADMACELLTKEIKDISQDVC